MRAIEVSDASSYSTQVRPDHHHRDQRFCLGATISARLIEYSLSILVFSPLFYFSEDGRGDDEQVAVVVLSLSELGNNRVKVNSFQQLSLHYLSMTCPAVLV